jgi:NAD(P)-dependent dehydrogenase (short-subunit alcohol dehydrogenase family)
MTGPADAVRPLAGSVAVVTGAGRGLGRAIALALADAGAAVALGARTPDQLTDVAAEIIGRGGRAVAVPTDVTVTAQVDGLVERAAAEFGRVDILVNNAGVIDPAPLVELTDEAWDTVLATNLRSTFLGVRAAGRYMRAQGSGRIINVASNFASMGIPGYAAYSASKAAVIALTRTAAIELARYGITVNAVAPGYFATDLNASARADEAVLRPILKSIPVRRMGAPAELGPLFVLLASDAGSFITGETIVVDGGQLAR